VVRVARLIALHYRDMRARGRRRFTSLVLAIDFYLNSRPYLD
jgi:hypothetical protein